MKRVALLLTFSVWGAIAYGQGQEHSLSYYMEAAKRNSPLLNDYRNQMQMEQDELQRLKAMYRHSRLEVNGDYLFVPIVSKDGGRMDTAFVGQLFLQGGTGAVADKH